MGKITDQLEIVPCKIADYRALENYVYVNRVLPPTVSVYKVRGAGKNRKSLPDPIAAIVFSMPLSCIRARNIATDNFFITGKSRPEQLKLINERIIYLSRLVVEPYFWKRGIGSWLQKTTVEMQEKPIIEVLTQYDFTAGTLQKIGFELHLNLAPEKYHRIKDIFSCFGISDETLKHPDLTWKRIQELELDRRNRLYWRIKKFLHGFGKIEKKFKNKEAVIFLLDQLKYPHAYLIKESIEHKKNREKSQ